MSNVKCVKSSNFGSGLRDDMLQFQLDNEVAASLIATSIGDKLNVQLLSKTGGAIGKPILLNMGDDSIESASLNDKTIVIKCVSGRRITCDVSGIFSEISGVKSELDIKKQDKLIAGQNITIAEDGKTISVTDLPALPKKEYSCRYMLVADYDATTNKWTYAWRECPNVAYYKEK